MRKLLLLLLIGWLPLRPVSALDLHVAPEGNDAWSGKSRHPNAARTDGPLATLAGARDALRQLKAAGVREPLRVLVADGLYRISEPLVLEPGDGGTAECPVRYEAEPGAQPLQRPGH